MLSLIYHRPGEAGERVLVGRLASIVSAIRGEPVESLMLEEVAGGSARPRGRAVLLMQLRGGHWLSLCRALGACPETVPPGVTAAWIYSQAAGLGGSVYLVYMRARRLASLQLEDLGRVAGVLESAGLRVFLASIERPGGEPSLPEKHGPGDGCVAVPMSMFRGGIYRSALLLAERLGCRAVEPMARSGLGVLASWLGLLH
ncbi:MAG: hypothetical protein GXO09_02205 [Crenarchaeota archaeon]|nr:hypothetical protein [Thermoproteota archaeon]